MVILILINVVRAYSDKDIKGCGVAKRNNAGLGDVGTESATDTDYVSV